MFLHLQLRKGWTYAAVLAVVCFGSISRSATLESGARLHQLGYQSWDTDAGLPQNTVRAIVQTDDGYLWLATYGGLVRFDGVRFTVFDTRNTPQLKSDRIRHLLKDSAGSLWISTPKGLARYSAGRFTAYTAESGLPTSDVSN